MIVYGKNVWTTLSQFPDQIETIYVQQGMKDKKRIAQIEQSNIPYQWMNRKQLDRIAQNPHHQGIVCEVKEIPTVELESLIHPNGLLVALDGIQDPQNVGAILRTCDCVGVDGMILTKHKSAGLTPSAIKASTGAAYTVPTCIVNNLTNTLKTLKKQGYWIIGTDMEKARDYREGIYGVPICLVIGSEGKGMSPLVKKQCDYVVKLPMEGSITSLNASVACGILLYQIHSQRHPL